jgi:uncharacterized membrane protein YeaQ/YmgE (transglycosylase-associated protein family)
MVTTIIGWILMGLVVGLIARLIHPGSDAMGTSATIVLGIVGSLVGGGIAYLFHLGRTPYQPGGWLLSIVGAVLVLAITAFGTRSRRI